MTKSAICGILLSCIGAIACSTASARPAALNAEWTAELFEEQFGEVMEEFGVKELPPSKGGLVAGLAFDIRDVPSLAKELSGGRVVPKEQPGDADTFQLAAATELVSMSADEEAPARDAVVHYRFRRIGEESPTALFVELSVAQRSRRDALAHFLGLADTDNEGYSAERSKGAKALGEHAGLKQKVITFDAGGEKTVVTEALFIRANVVVRVFLGDVDAMKPGNSGPQTWVMKLARYLDKRLALATKYKSLIDSGEVPIVENLQMEAEPGTIHLAGKYPIAITARDPNLSRLEAHFQMPEAFGGSTIARELGTNDWSLHTGHKPEDLDATLIVVNTKGLVATKSLSVSVTRRP